MVTIMDLWLPIVLSAAGIFFMSFLNWMVLPHHQSDWGPVKNEDDLMNDLQKQELKPGQYSFPHCKTPKDMGSEAWLEKVNRGPVGTIVVVPSGPPTMGKALGTWFVFLVVMGFCVAYVASRTLDPAAGFGAVFRIVGTVAVLAYAGAHAPGAIWMGRTWSSVTKDIFDSAIYGVITGLLFAAFWPTP